MEKARPQQGHKSTTPRRAGNPQGESTAAADPPQAPAAASDRVRQRPAAAVKPVPPEFLTSAVLIALLVTFLFRNMYFLTETNDYYVLGLLFAFTVFSLVSGYQYTEGIASLADASGKRDRSPEERAWFALLSQNLLFFSVFAFFAAVVLPQFESRDVPRFPWVHAVGSVVPAALSVYFSGRL